MRMFDPWASSDPTDSREWRPPRYFCIVIRIAFQDMSPSRTTIYVNTPSFASTYIADLKAEIFCPTAPSLH
jgi:hypothetical protein